MSHDDPQAVTREDTAPDREPSLGERLRSAREAQPLSLAQIAGELRIEQRYLTALEEDRLDAFAAPVFTKGYLKQYGNMLGLDERDLLAQYYRQAAVRDVPVMRHKPIRLRDENRIRHGLAAAVVLAVLGGGAVTWWVAQPAPEPLNVRQATPAVVAPPVSVTPPALEPELDEGVLAVELVTEPRAVAAPSGAAAPEAAPADGARVEIELAFTEDCWTEISDAAGERLFYGLGSAGARSRFGATLPISVFFGNASGVALSLNGSPYSIPPGSRQGNLARFVIAEPGD